MPLTRKAAEFNQQQRAQRTEKKVHVAHFIAELFSGKVSQLTYVTTCVIYIFININKYDFKLTLVNSIVVVVQSLSHV